jgi:protein phosphatase
MAQQTQSAAVSHVGKVRSNNQDSGYAGRNLFVVADGMGGHAGGDVASAIALNRIAEIDGEYTSPEEALISLQSALVGANSQLAETVFEHPELTGMGTTVSALVRVGTKVVIAHIGDSRIYLYRDGELKQVSTDHTFVQRLVDTGRITEEEALTHPRRSVLMRVLGDVDSSPEIDSWILDTRPGDRWLICSDGLSGVIKPTDLDAALAKPDAPYVVANRLVRLSLDAGAPDNVTVVILDVGDPGELPDTADSPITVGSAASPLAFDHDMTRSRPLRLPSLRLHPVSPATGPTHFEAQTEDYLDELIEEDERRARRRKLFWLVGSLLVAIAIALACVFGYQWTQSRYYVGQTSDGNVAIFKGVQQSLGPISLSSIYQEQDIRVDSLPGYEREMVKQTINANSLEDAYRIVKQLSDDG